MHNLYINYALDKYLEIFKMLLKKRINFMKPFTQNRLNHVLQVAVNHGSIVGTGVIVAHQGSVIFEGYYGYANREKGVPVTNKTIFRLASMTKPLVSAAALALVEQNKLDLHKPITDWLPAFKPRLANGVQPIITLYHLLTHTSGLSYGFLTSDNEPYFSAGISDGLDERVLSLDENLHRLASVSLLFPPGEGWCYSMSTDVIGAILQKTCDQPLSEIIKKLITDPSGMNDTSFDLKDVDRLSVAYADSLNLGAARLMQSQDQMSLQNAGVIHYAPDRILNRLAYPSGGSGMIGTARDYLIFLEAIRKGGYPIITKRSVSLMTQDLVKAYDVNVGGPGYGFGMGFAVIRDSNLADTPRAQGSYGWGGVYGTSMFVDPENELSVVILTNTALEGLIGKFPLELTQAIYQSYVSRP